MTCVAVSETQPGTAGPLVAVLWLKEKTGMLLAEVEYRANGGTKVNPSYWALITVKTRSFGIGTDVGVKFGTCTEGLSDTINVAFT
jgi:hypothetical protein